MRVGVITKGIYGIRLVAALKEHSGFKVHTAALPLLPLFVDDPEEFVNRLNIDEEIFNVDLLILYSLHPDVTPELIKRGIIKGVKSFLVPGGLAKNGLHDKNLSYFKKQGVHVQSDDICCMLDFCGNEELDRFCENFGSPKFKIQVENGIIKKVDVIRGSPCGGSWLVASSLEGVRIEDAPSRAGLFIQMYPCRASRGLKGKIHESGEIHKKAVLDALGALKNKGTESD